MMKRFLAVLIGAAAMCAAIANVAATPVTMKSREVLPPAYFRSLHFEIEDTVAFEDYFYEFTIHSEYGHYRVSSLPMLRVRVHEILTMAALDKQLNPDAPAFDRNPGGRRGVGSDSVADIVSDPLGTAGKLLGNLRHNFEETFIESPEIDADDLARGHTEVDPGPHKRSAAAQLDVDVYSSNEILQGMLDDLAAARSAGKIRKSIIPAVSDATAPVRFGTGLLDAQLRSKLKNQSAAEVNGEVDEHLAALGIADPLRVALRAHPRFTPRLRLYLTAYLEQLDATADLHHLVAAATRATTEADALAFVNLARMAAFLQLNGHPVRRVVMHRGFPLLLTADNTLALPLPVDRFTLDGANTSLIDELQELAQSLGVTRLSVLVAGNVDAGTAALLAERGVRVRTAYSF